MRKYLLMPLLLLLVMSASAFAKSGHGEGAWKWWENENITNEINLTQEQTTELEKIYESYEPRLDKLNSAYKEKKKVYYDTMSNAQAPRGEVVSAFEEMSRAGFEAKKLKLDMKLDMRQVLTPEQIDGVNEYVRDWKEKHREKHFKKHDK